MENLQKYREWLKARGLENPSREEIERFKKQTRKSPFGSALEFLYLAWMDRRRKYSGTRYWLAKQGLPNPSEEDLKYYGRKIRRAALWRTSVAFVLFLGWFIFLWWAGLAPFGRGH
jgi:hypothetical protein